MSPAEIHVAVVHFPVIGGLFTLAVMALGMVLKDRRFVLTGCVMTVVCAIAAAVAYGSGPKALDQLRPALDPQIVSLAETHAVVARAAFMVGILAGIVALQGLLRTAADEGPSPWLVRTLVVLLLVVFGLMAWAAHLGGGIRHPEVRGTHPVVRDR